MALGVPISASRSAFAEPFTVRRGMKKESGQSVDHSEPIGIIISNGDRGEQPTVFSAYIWGPAPEPTVDPASKAA